MADTAVYTGIWRDYSKSSGNQLTITTTSNAAAVLVAALAIVVQITGAAIWAIVAFFLHQRRATKGLQDELSSQSSIILRNSGIVSSIVQTWGLRKWIGHAPQVRLRMLKLMTIPVLIKLGFIIAAVLSANVAYDPTKSHVLIIPKNCGFLPTNSTDLERLADEASFVPRARAYAKDCYSLSTHDVDCSGTWQKDNLPYTIHRNIPCPLGSNYCSLGDDGAVTFWSMLDSNEDFGINAPIQDRMRIGFNLTCAPLKPDLIESFASIEPGTSTTLNGTRYDTLKYALGNTDELSFLYNNISNTAVGSMDYRVESVDMYYYWPINETSATLYAPFNGTGLDTHLVFIIPNAVVYTSPSNDPIFGTAKESLNSSTPPLPGMNSYPPLHPINTIGCWQSYAFCNPENSKCTNWVGAGALTAPFDPTLASKFGDILDPLEVNEQQRAVAFRLQGARSTFDMPTIFLAGPQLLAMGQIVYRRFSLPLAKEQWFHEARFWFETILASLPITMQTYVNTNATSVEPPTTPELEGMCHQQLRRLTAGYQNFSLLGVLIIFVFGALAILIAGFLRGWYHVLPRRKPGQDKHHKALAWWQDGYLQLHRKALEGSGVDGWIDHDVKYKDGPVPVVDKASKRVPPLHGETAEERTGVQRSNEIPFQTSELSPIKHIGTWGEQSRGWEKVTQFDVEDNAATRSSSRDTETTLA